MKHKLYTRLLSLALAVGLVIGMLPSAAAVDTVGDTQARNTPSVWSVSFTKKLIVGERTTTLNFKVYDTEGNPLTVASSENLSLSYNGEETEKEYAIQDVLKQQGLDEIETADGEKWIYQNTLFIDDGKIRTINAFGDYDPKVIGSSTVKLYDAVFEVGGFYSRDGSADIRMMYRKASDTESGDVHTEMDLERHKTVTKNPDGTYNLELSVSGAVGNITDPVKLDVMFIVDQSGSMKEELSNGTNRAEAVVNAVRSMTNQLESNQNIDPHYSVVTFSSGINGTQYYKDAIQKLYWTDNAGAAVSAVTINPNGGTNYEAGLLMGRAMLMGSRPNAQKVVIFLSDGKPTYHYENGNTRGDGGETTDEDIEYAYAEAARMTNVNAFYSIRVGSESGADAILQGICDKVHASSVGSADENFKVYSAQDVDELNSVFDQIQGNITQVLCDHVSVEDTLSENVQPVEDAFPQVTVTNESGEIVKTPNGITASLTGKELKLSFPKDYKLEKGYEYKVSLTIEPTDLAYQKYSNNGLQYPDFADKDTGTHQEQYGFYSNDEATVTYTYNGQTQVNDYPKPVIQLNPGTLTITKQITGDLTEEQLAALEKSIKFDVVLNEASTSYQLSGFTKSDDNFYTMSIRGLSPDTKYTVTETGADFPGYVLDASSTGEKGTIAKGGTATAAFTNKYTPDTGSLTITKTVVGLDSTALAELKDEISFVVKNSADEAVATINKDSEDWNAAWSGSNFTYTIENLPTGTYTVTESGYNDITNYIWQESATTATGTVVYNAAGTPAALTNTYTPADGYLTINKVINGDAFGDGRDTFNFKVTATSGKDEGKVWYFTIKGAGETEAIKLPVGKYTIEELSNINYTCDVDLQTVTIDSSNTEANPATVTFTNTPSKTDIPTDSGGVKNVAEIREGQITWKQEPENDKKPTPEPTHD